MAFEEIASGQGVKRSTYEEHLRKAELKILQTMKHYARLAYSTPKDRWPGVTYRAKARTSFPQRKA